MNPLKTIVLFLFCMSITFAQSGKVNDTIIASQYFKKADALLNDKKLDSSIIYFKKALKIQNELFQKKEEKLLKTHKKIYNALMLLNQHSEALEYLNNIEVITNKIYKENSLEVADLYFDYGSYFYGIGFFDKSLSYYKKCFLIQNHSPDLDSQELGVTCGRIGRSLMRKYSFTEALKYFKKALVFEQKSKKTNTVWVGAYLNNIGIAYRRKNDYEKAKEYTNKAYDVYSSVLDKDHSRIANCYHSMGLILVNQNKYEEAILYLNKSLDIRTRTIGKTHFKTANLYASIAQVYSEELKYDKALENYNTTLEIITNILGEGHQWISGTYNDIAYLHIKTKNYTEALFFFNKALSSNRIENRRSIHSESYYDQNTQLFSMIGKAKVLKKLYEKFCRKKDLLLSQKIYHKIYELIDILKLNYTEYKDKISFVGIMESIGQESIETELLLNNSRNDLKTQKQLFYFIEKSKSNTLKDLLNDSYAKSFSGLSADLISLEKDLRIDKAYYQSKVHEQLANKQVDSVRLLNWESKLFDISRKQDSLTDVLEKNYPNYYELKYNNRVISATEVQQKLDDSTTLLEFFTGDSITYAFTISKNKMAVKELPTPDLEEQLERFHHSITKNGQTHKAISYQLYEQLIAPVKANLVGTQLIIVPDGALWHLNFDLLHTRQDPSNNPKNWSFLLKEYAISYANSATLLFDKDNARNDEIISSKAQECLAFSFSGNSNLSDTKTLSLHTLRNSSIDLPGTREEIKAQNFKKLAGDYNMLHLAVHGDVDNEHPENSKLYFTKSKDTLDDNFLYSHELFALDIPAELVVLSACNTGTGKIAKGEGIMSLGTAFQYAGTKSLVLTNWEVSDKTTPKIMEYFYSNLREGKNKAAALQQAKLQFLTTTSPETNHPYYWGGFYLLGDVAPIQFANNNYKYWMLGAGILAMILLSLFWYRKKISN